MRILRLESARSEHGWNVAESQPSDGSKLRTETVRGAAPIPERPPVATSVTVVSLMKPFSSFQKVRNDVSSQIIEILYLRGSHVPGDTRGSLTHGLQMKKRYPRVQSFNQGGLLTARRGTAAKLSSRTHPIRPAPKDPNYKGVIKLIDGTEDSGCTSSDSNA